MSTTLFPTSLVRHPSPIGLLGIHARAGRLIRLDIATAGVLPGDGLPERAEPVHDDVRRQLDEYFAGRRHRFDLPLETAGTVFQEEVWALLDAVPFGESTTYGELARQSGRPMGARAVGGAIAANRIALVIPCHRVLGTDGRVTGYSPGDGLPTKLWLLDHEGVLHRGDSRQRRTSGDLAPFPAGTTDAEVRRR